MTVTLCVPPRDGELCLPLLFELPGEHTTQQLTARHRVGGVQVSEDGKVLVAIEITDPATARPVDVRFDVVPQGAAAPRRAQFVGTVDKDGTKFDVYGTYLGPVADENLARRPHVHPDPPPFRTAPAQPGLRDRSDRHPPRRRSG